MDALTRVLEVSSDGLDSSLPTPHAHLFPSPVIDLPVPILQHSLAELDVAQEGTLIYVAVRIGIRSLPIHFRVDPVSDV